MGSIILLSWGHYSFALFSARREKLISQRENILDQKMTEKEEKERQEGNNPVGEGESSPEEKEEDDELLPGYQKVKTTEVIHTQFGWETVDTADYSNVVDRHVDIVNEVAKKYVDLKDQYEMYMYNDVEVFNEGLPVEYSVLYWKIVLRDRKTKKDETVGYIEYADNCLSTLTPEEQKDDYIVVYPDSYIREQTEEIFKEWLKEKEEGEEDE